MRYEIEIRRRAEKDLASIQKADAQKIVDAIIALENELVGDIKNEILPEVQSPRLSVCFRRASLAETAN